MFCALDVHYGDEAATTAAVGFEAWADGATRCELVCRSESPPAPYVPGRFYQREMPHLLRAVRHVSGTHPLEVVLVDGHAWLGTGRPGLGAHLYEALEKRIPVIGVAKKPFRDGVAIPVFRGRSRQPLHVTAAGMDPSEAAEHVRTMHGPHRIPTLLKRADRLARELQLPAEGKRIPCGGGRVAGPSHRE